jgi:hypothetical protein
MREYKRITREKCEHHCVNTFGCKGIEYFEKSNSKKARDIYKQGNCNLSDSLDTTACSAEVWQMILWTKKEIDCIS